MTLGLGLGTNHAAAWGGGDPGTRTSVLKPAKCRQAEVVTLQGPKELSSFLETSPDAHSRLSSNIQIVKKRLGLSILQCHLIAQRAQGTTRWHRNLPRNEPGSWQ